MRYAAMDMVFPTSLAQAAAALGKRGAVPLAGATDVIMAIRRGQMAPAVLVNLKSIPDLAGVRRVRSAVRIGALTKIADLLSDPIITADLPLIVEVARGFGSVQMRNLATIGGNICNAAPSADMALPLLVLDARLGVYAGGRRREIAIDEFFLGNGKCALRKGEILTSITIAKPGKRVGAAHEKLAIRQAMDLAFVAVAGLVRLSPDGRKCQSARIALGAVAPTPMRAAKAEAMLEGEAISDELISKAAAAASAESRPITDLRASKEYRKEMVEVLTRRVLQEAVSRARQEAR